MLEVILTGTLTNGQNWFTTFVVDYQIPVVTGYAIDITDVDSEIVEEESSSEDKNKPPDFSPKDHY